MDAPPKQQKAKSLRFAATLNFILPGAGQFYLGQRVFGSVLALVFLGCFLASLAIFVRGYTEYIRIATSGDIFEPNVLEQLGNIFHLRWLIGLLVTSTIVFIIAMVGLAFMPKETNGPANV